MGWISLTNITLLIVGVYVAFTMKSLFDLFYPASCSGKSSNECIYSIKNWQNQYTLGVCVPSKQASSSQIQCSQYLSLSDLDLKESFTKELQLELPAKTQNNGSLNAILLLTPKSNADPTMAISRHSSDVIFKEMKLSKYKLNVTKYINLLETAYKKESTAENEIDKKKQREKPITHLLTRINVYTLDSSVDFDRYQVPAEIYSDLKINQNGEYLPILHIDYLSAKDDFYKPLNASQSSYVLTVEHSPISIGRLRFFKQLDMSVQQLKDLGFAESQLGEIISIFTETHVYVIFLTFLVSVLHLLFEFLAFKNDINFWRKRKTTVGLSVKTLAWRTVTQVIILANLMQEDTSLLITIPSLISIFIEVWKLLKAFKVTVDFSSSIIPKFHFGEYTKQEIESNSYDSMAMTKLSYLLYPICILGAIYSLVYSQHRNWLAWLINSLANGVYAFGFLFMTPQLFLNYKLKSVAHLPWKAFMYKAFNTFIDDVFAFIIKMPTTHRLACLRDDVVFLVYLYQRWLYPIDKTRANEFGESFDEDTQKKSN